MEPGIEWPSSGDIEIGSVSATYDIRIENIHSSIGTGEKVAICGRTESGKSSLLHLFLKFLNAHPSTSHSISIDGTRLHLIHRPTLRSRIIAIAQTTFLLHGDFRPTQQRSLRVRLKAVPLWDLVVENGGLHSELKDESLSHGQKQLFYLARAIVRARVRAERLSGNAGGILLLDEVNSSLDRETDKFMQGVIKNKFATYTVLCVAPNLDAIMDYDGIVVMDRGEIVEVGEPGGLLRRSDGKFIKNSGR
ncbi:P-loop containing nucleoside triphosphate hydrolase protein [Bisporella sp. PMI_857]|nr:P-loop containing nucleoside triphosphate hydrolase protein [Bisporella sp. PMI_857]